MGNLVLYYYRIVLFYFYFSTCYFCGFCRLGLLWSWLLASVAFEACGLCDFGLVWF